MQANVENGIREIRDQNVAILLLTFGFPVVNSRREGGTVYVGFDAEATEDTIQALRGNRPLPLADARMFIVGMATWKALIRDLT